jgi:hypothetical protein
MQKIYKTLPKLQSMTDPPGPRGMGFQSCRSKPVCRRPITACHRPTATSYAPEMDWDQSGRVTFKVGRCTLTPPDP